MALQTSTIQSICDKVASQYHYLLTAFDAIEADSPDYFPYVTADGDFGFELKMNPSLVKGDNWNMKDLVKASPIDSIIGGLFSYFSTSRNNWEIDYPGSLDNYLYVNGMTVSKYFADSVYYCNGYKMAGILVDNTDVFTFAEFGKTSGNIAYFTSLGSYQTEDINAPYGTYTDYISFAPTDQIELEIVTGAINFDIKLICKDKNGDTFIYQQSLSGTEGETITLNLTEKITGVAGLQTPYDGNANDLFRIKTISLEV